MRRDPRVGLLIGEGNIGQRDKPTRQPDAQIRKNESEFRVTLAVVAGAHTPTTTYHQHTRKG